jgi:hypothetical protein
MADEPIEGVCSEEDEETVDGLPVLADVRPIQPVVSRTPAVRPAVQAAAAAATGFVAGAATLAVAHHLASRKLARVSPVPQRRPFEFLPIVSTRTFLVDVHLIAKPGE